MNTIEHLLATLAEEALEDMLMEMHKQASALRNRLLSVALVTGCGMFIGYAAARFAVAGGFDLGLSSAAKTLDVLSHAYRVDDRITAVEEAVMAAGDPPTRKDLAVIHMHAARLASACAAACGMLEAGARRCAA